MKYKSLDMYSYKRETKTDIKCIGVSVPFTAKEVTLNKGQRSSESSPSHQEQILHFK
jgi:hypothetical protein